MCVDYRWSRFWISLTITNVHQKHHHTYITNDNEAIEQLDDVITKGNPSIERCGEPPHGSLGSVIDQSYCSSKSWIAKMNVEGVVVHGSRWASLAINNELKRLVIKTTANQVTYPPVLVFQK
ncbi:hypothetical protein LXL04_007314 [Taraxacum kok-saghyz]